MSRTGRIIYARFTIALLKSTDGPTGARCGDTMSNDLGNDQRAAGRTRRAPNSLREPVAVRRRERRLLHRAALLDVRRREREVLRVQLRPARAVLAQARQPPRHARAPVRGRRELVEADRAEPEPRGDEPVPAQEVCTPKCSGSARTWARECGRRTLLRVDRRVDRVRVVAGVV
jgi:hypothetical protein